MCSEVLEQKKEKWTAPDDSEDNICGFTRIYQEFRYFGVSRSGEVFTCLLVVKLIIVTYFTLLC